MRRLTLLHCALTRLEDTQRVPRPLPYGGETVVTREENLLNPQSGKKTRMVVGAAAMIAAVGLATPAIASADDLSGSLDLGSSILDGLTGGGSSGNQGAPTVQRCNAQTLSGGAGVTTTRYLMGRTGPMSFNLRYDTENIPDKIVVSYQGRVVANTGYVGDNLNEGQGSIRVHVPKGTDSSVVVQVTGPNDTEWHYTLYCP